MSDTRMPAWRRAMQRLAAVPSSRSLLGSRAERSTPELFGEFLEESSREGLRNDWEQVGADISAGIERVRVELHEQQGS